MLPRTTSTRVGAPRRSGSSDVGSSDVGGWRNSSMPRKVYALDHTGTQYPITSPVWGDTTAADAARAVAQENTSCPGQPITPPPLGNAESTAAAPPHGACLRPKLWASS